LTHTRLALFSVIVAASLAACSKQPAQNARPDGTGQTAPASAPQMAPSHAPATVPPEQGSVAAPSAPSTVTPIADVWANRKTLAGKAVTVHGKVVKFNGGILGRNWVHIQDGTGKPDDKTNDLTVTTADEAAVGDQITVTGTVGIDRDFTAGYAYPVIVENAHIVKK
jgi:hypothetical protein